ncbi:hypothetical protein EGW08_011890 [Elysia chlorotica]|uniref:F-box domain-containing protein n=1 Tax=Elysia chlorotica TaxID=188477 RepID=A0A3S1B5H5_ELYCH|nr:hypothetical protein EGW08_011890 [Elysia chlorotica]
MASSEETLDVSNPVEVIEGSISRDSPSGTHNDGVQPASTILSDDTESLTGEEQTNYSEWNNVDSDSELILTHLPEIVLVHMMEYLDLRARYYLSRTCRLFYDLFSHPQLWQIAQISLLTQGERRGRNPYHWKLQAVMHHTMAMIVHKFSHLFQHLSLELLQYIQPFDNDSKMLLQHLARECRLESLSIKLGPLTSSDRDISHISSRLSNYQDLHLVVSLVQNASRLKRLSLISWPFFESTNDNKDIFKALITNQKLISLESFNFFFPELKNSQWTDRIPKLPSPELTIRVVSQLKNVTQLALRSPMLSDELVLQLAKKRVPLLTFKILIMYSRDSVLMKGFKVPEISSKAWNALRKSSPELAVEYYVFNRVPQEQLGLMLQPEVQLASINILTFGRCDKELVTVLAERYSRTLRQFVSLCDSPNCEEALINLVRSCDLTHLIYYGDISFKAVEKIATVVKDYGQEIESFEFKEKNITTEEENDDEDLVVAKDGESNEYYLTSLKSWHVDATERSKRIDAMSEHVSKCLGFHWRPLT